MNDEHDTPKRHAASLKLGNDRDQIESLEDDILEAVESFGYPKTARFAIKLALEEALANAFQHGNPGTPDAPIDVAYEVVAEQVCITIDDHGPGFNPAAIADPTLDENIASPGGRGIMLMRAYMTEVRHNAAGNRVELIYAKP